MKITRNVARLLILLIVFSIAGCDQISKNIVRTSIGYNENIKIGIKNITLTKVENTGAFLSVGSYMPAFMKFILLIALPFLVMLFGMFYILTKDSLPRMVVIGIAFVLGGGIGNLYDRVIFGSVTDFLHIDFVIFKTGIFNVADLAIMTGMLLIVINIYNNKLMVLNIKSSGK